MKMLDSRLRAQVEGHCVRKKELMSNENGKIQRDFKDIQETESTKRPYDPAIDPDGHSQLPNNLMYRINRFSPRF